MKKNNSQQENSLEEVSGECQSLTHSPPTADSQRNELITSGKKGLNETSIKSADIFSPNKTDAGTATRAGRTVQTGSDSLRGYLDLTDLKKKIKQAKQEQKETKSDIYQDWITKSERKLKEMK